MPRKKLESSAAEVAASSPESATAAKPVRKTTRKTAAAAPAKPKRTPQPKATPVAASGPDPAVEPSYDPTEQITRLAHAIYQARQRRGEEWGTPEGDWAYAEVLYREGVTNLE